MAAGDVACVYAILVSWLIYHEARLKDVFDAAAHAMYRDATPPWGFLLDVNLLLLAV